MKPKAVVLKAAMLPLLLLWCFVAVDGGGEEEFPGVGPLLVRKECRRTVASTASGEITAVDVRDGYGVAYHLQFITMAPSSLFLPVLLHTDMVFYVQSGMTSRNSSTREKMDAYIKSWFLQAAEGSHTSKRTRTMRPSTSMWCMVTSTGWRKAACSTCRAIRTQRETT